MADQQKPAMFSSLPPVDNTKLRQLEMLGKEISDAAKDSPELADRLIAILDSLSIIVNDADPSKQKAAARKLAAIEIMVKETQHLGGAQAVGETLEGEGADTASSVAAAIQKKVAKQMP